MNESKLTYIALVLASAAAVVSLATAGLSTLPQGARINALSQQMEVLTRDNKALQDQLETVKQDRTRIDELDVGMVALASVLKVDRVELAKAIAAAKSVDQATPRTAEVPAGQPQAPGASQPAPAPRPAVASTKDNEQPQAPKEPPVHSDKAGQVASLGADNPFSGSPEANDPPTALTIAVAPQEPAPAQAQVAAPLPPMTIQQVDGVLAKRISENWFKPAGVADNLSAIVQVNMHRDGKVASVKLAKASGSEAFDTSVISSIMSINTLPEVQRLSDSDFKKGYASRAIRFTPQMGG